MAVWDLMSPKLTGKTAAVEGQVWSAFNSPPGTYTRNSSNPMNGFDQSGLPIDAYGALISPSHLLIAWHVRPGNGTVISFLDSNGTVVTRTVVSTTRVNNPTPPDTGDPQEDLGIARLNAAVPNTVTPLSILPPDVRLKYNNNGIRCPGVWLRVPTRTLYAGLLHVAGRDKWAIVAYPTQSYTDVLGIPDWEKFVVGGDSGSPFMVLIPGQPTPTLIGCVYLQANRCPDLTYWATEIRSIVQAGGEDVTYADLSGFNDV